MLMSMTAVYGQAEAAAICGVSLRTIQRHRGSLEAAGAWRDRTGRWQIPVTALAAAGFRPGRADVVSRPAGAESRDAATADVEIAALRLRAEVAEARLEELRQLVEVQAQALRQLESGGRLSQPQRPQPPSSHQPGPLAWVRRLF